MEWVSVGMFLLCAPVAVMNLPLAASSSCSPIGELGRDSVLEPGSCKLCFLPRGAADAPSASCDSGNGDVGREADVG